MSENNQYEILWKAIRENLEQTLAHITYTTYISGLKPVDIDGTRIVLKTDTEFFAKTIVHQLKDKIKAAITKADTGITDFVLMVEGSDEPYYRPDEEEFDEDYTPVAVDPRFTFESFVAGKSNEFVFAAAQSVAKNPGAVFNPLYIYGASGLGKTHLLQSIVNYLNLHKPSLRVLYTACEKFINEFIDSIYLKGGNSRDLQAKFRNRYRNVDVLLIDDVQFLANKQAVQEELFHTFNALQAENKQVVLTSDVPPKEIATLEERLRTRFEGGLIADIQPPDTETKIAILKQKAFERKAIVPPDVLEFLARDSGTDVRTLEGRLTKVVFASKLHEQPVTMELAMTALREAVSEEHETVTADKIIGSICFFYKISRENLLGKSKKKELVQPRQICAYLMCEIMNIPLVSIGEALGGRDHTTVIHSREKITNLIKVNDRIAKEVEDIRNMILKQ
ncbi:MAG TPA: chromosomal replication initiator protein DnaA [Candidatus Borkfalkia stercoripullorum]|nr:chromosomal replication initiator protein DnaA [Candidatus Borkfalkia stercoripullorum]